MDKFNNQFSTQKLRQEADNNWPETITSRYRDEYLFIHDENNPGFYNVKDLDTGKIVGRFGFKTPEKAVEFAKDKIKPQGGRQSSGLGETSMTSAGATFTPGTGEQMATNKAFKKKPKTEEKDVEPKLAAGKAKVYMKDKWGWEDAPSIPNRPSKGGFIYKQLFEELSYTAFNHYRSSLNDAYGDLVRGNDPYAKIVGDAYNSLDIKDNPDSIYKLDNAKKAIDASKNLVDQQKNYYKKAIDKIKEYLLQAIQEDAYDVYEPEEQDDDEDRYDWFTDKYEPVSDYGKYRKDPDYYEKDYQQKGTGDYFQKRSLDEIKLDLDLSDKTLERLIMLLKGHMSTEIDLISSLEKALGREVDPFPHLKESYSKFKTETKTRGKSDQFHQAVREVRKKVLEINRLFEYVSRLKSELSEGEGGLKYKIHTEKALAKIKEMVSELNQNIKKFK